MDDNTKKKLAQVGLPTMMLGIGITLGSLAGGSDDAAKVAATTADRSAMSVAIDEQRHIVDPSKYNDVIVPLRAKDPQLVDFLTREVESGATTTTGANFPLGARLTVDPPIWVSEPWLVLDATCADHADEQATWCEVTAQNTTTDAARAVFLVRWEQTEVAPTTDAGVEAVDAAP